MIDAEVDARRRGGLLVGAQLVEPVIMNAVGRRICHSRRCSAAMSTVNGGPTAISSAPIVR